MLTHDEMVRKMLKRPAVKAEHDAQLEEFALLDELLRARRRAGLTQAEVAARMPDKYHQPSTPAVTSTASIKRSLRKQPQPDPLKSRRALG
jgi:hypothetical protein